MAKIILSAPGGLSRENKAALVKQTADALGVLEEDVVYLPEPGATVSVIDVPKDMAAKREKADKEKEAAARKKAEEEEAAAKKAEDAKKKAEAPAEPNPPAAPAFHAPEQTHHARK